MKMLVVPSNIKIKKLLKCHKVNNEAKLEKKNAAYMRGYSIIIT